ncbi:MAG TPA: LytTR family DNA-binding domain-containing protein [Verrucomicrobiae bacterium]
MPDKIRTLIVDDEELARERLRSLLSREPRIEVIGEAGDGKAAVTAIEKEKPDLVFLDVQMPELNGFEVLEALDEETRPNIVFCTAHDKFALKAFDVHAVDYLLKPFDRERLQKALERAIAKVDLQRGGQKDASVSAVLKEVKPATPVERLLVKGDGRVLLIKVEDIDYVEAADNYVNLRVGKDSHMMRETMASLEQRLPPDRFMRISRSNIVNVERIQELQPMFHGEYVVVLKNGTKLTLSRSYRDKLDRLLGSAG